MKTIVRTVVSLGIATACFAVDTPLEERKISVSGTASTQVVPDLINWSISTSYESTNLVEAKESSDRKSKSILALASELGVKPEDVQTGYVNISRKYDQDEHGRRPDFKGFRVRRGFTLKQHDLARFDEFLSKLVSSAEMEVGFSLTSTTMTELRWDTRVKAVKIAKDTAVAMAETAGQNLANRLNCVSRDRKKGAR